MLHGSHRPFVELLEELNLLSFLPPVEYRVGEFPRSVAAGDFRDIGRLDLVVANINSDFLSVLLSNGDGTFQDAVNYPVDSQPHFAMPGDFHGDGKLDLLATCSAAGTLNLLRGNGDGTFQPPTRQVGGGDWPHRMVVGDFNGDGVLDVAMVNSFSDNFSVFLGNGDGTFRLAQTLPVPRDPVGIAMVDFKGDGKLDLAVASFDFFDGGGGNVQVFLGAGDGTFTAGAVYDTGGDAWSVAAGDFGNGKVDLAVTNGDGAVAVLMGVGDGTFQSPVYYAAGAYPVDVAAADLDNRGILDLVTANEGADDVSVLRGNGDGTFQSPESIKAGANPFYVLVTDLNNDGAPDLVTANSGSASISVLLNDRGLASHSNSHTVYRLAADSLFANSSWQQAIVHLDSQPARAGIGQSARPDRLPKAESATPPHSADRGSDYAAGLRQHNVEAWLPPLRRMLSLPLTYWYAADDRIPAVGIEDSNP
jgi:hypothetical protein